MLVADLQHFLDLPAGIPAPARRLAEQLGDIVRAGSAGEFGEKWTSGLPCTRRPGNRCCPGRIILARSHEHDPIRWRCSTCPDEGTISNWADSPYDLRRQALALAGRPNEIVIPAQVAAALRDLRLLDRDSERLVFAMRMQEELTVLAATDEELDELLGHVAAEANHESNRPRRERLDGALAALSDAVQAGG